MDRGGARDGGAIGTPVHGGDNSVGVEIGQGGRFTSHRPLVVRLRHLHPPDTGLGANVGVKRTTSKLLVPVELLNLTFDLEPDVRRDSHVKFAPRRSSRPINARLRPMEPRSMEVAVTNITPRSFYIDAFYPNISEAIFGAWIAAGICKCSTLDRRIYGHRFLVIARPSRFISIYNERERRMFQGSLR
ncbi:hypothetical protein C7450_111187 [Chelatococcus asaccharovorans]|uniref:Uncharacterized protein n=1 Tax=Chelatococcus asaccharovorans TaxID=28210 RepID=A0A2V3U9H7_9HYPH|nr:hypothetical protein C7450_111187 [Chelatococcus asaccharovorans]